MKPMQCIIEFKHVGGDHHSGPRGVVEATMNDHHDIAGLEPFALTVGCRTRTVYRAGRGPAVIVLHGLPGLYRTTIGFAHRLIDRGYTVYLPSLFGRPGREFSLPYLAASAVRLSVSNDIFLFAGTRTSPIVDWLHGLTSVAYEESGQRAVGSVGMSVTAGLALGMMTDHRVSVAVLSQPVLPLRVGQCGSAQLPLDASDLRRILDRELGTPSVLGLRFTRDVLVRGSRFRALQSQLGKIFTSFEIDSSRGNAYGVPRRAHAVITGYLGRVPNYPTRLALEFTLEFLCERLKRQD
jgi:dienelactone hydrolase